MRNYCVVMELKQKKQISQHEYNMAIVTTINKSLVVVRLL